MDNKEMIATLLENQRLMNEKLTDTNDIGKFKRISIPLVRRIFPQLIMNNLVNVQPMSAHVVMEEDTVASRKKQIRKKQYRSIDDAWEQS
jgi:hypothetical protein